MITFTEAARGKVLELLAGEGRQGSAMRFSISGRMGGVFQYRLAFMKPEEREPGDALADAGGFQVVVDARSAPHLAGTVVDYVEAPSQSGFKIDNPNPLWSDPLATAVQRLIDDEINPALASHGGFVHLLELREGVAHVELGGGCQGCGMAKATRRRFSAAYKCKILRDAKARTQPGELGALLRREGLYSSNLTTWRAQRQAGELGGLAPKRRGPAPQAKNPLAVRVVALEREMTRLKARAERAEALVELQKKVSELLGIALPRNGEQT